MYVYSCKEIATHTIYPMYVNRSGVTVTLMWFDAHSLGPCAGHAHCYMPSTTQHSSFR